MGWLAAAQRRIGFDLEISEGTAAVVIERWRRSRCDLALFADARGDDRLTSRSRCWREAYVLATSTDHLVATRDRWSAAELADTPFMLRAACEAQDEATRLFAKEGSRPRAVLRSTGEERCAAAVHRRAGRRADAALAGAARHDGGRNSRGRLERRVTLAWRGNADPEIVAALRETAGRRRLARAESEP